ncbi:unnamed protein product [Trifolium pratense]|uniref:Uncharacterized protein n=1 Tax=Trifolium pratense TaxID=57577 RepID=A0ACB0IM65_TRIPR|nr:unnamed protein product [Trifolium pratense]
MFRRLMVTNGPQFLVFWLEIHFHRNLQVLNTPIQRKLLLKGGVADCAYWKDNSLCHNLDVMKELVKIDNLLASTSPTLRPKDL